MDQIPNIALGLKCPKCSCPLGELSDQQFLLYLHGKSSSCQQCDGDLELFKIVANCIEQNFFFNDVFAFVGAKKSTFKIMLDPKPSTTLAFEDHGIPKGSRILHINYTPQGGGVFPLEFHSNTPSRKPPKDSVILFPARFTQDREAATEICVMVTWIDSDSLENVSLKSLVDAFEEYSQGEYLISIVPANTSIELDVMRYTESALEELSSRTSVKEFFKSGISYVPTLKVLVPLLSRLKGFPAMPDSLFKSLVELASFRNQIAHTGKTRSPLTKKQVVNSLTGAVLGKWYFKLLRNA